MPAGIEIDGTVQQQHAIAGTVIDETNQPLTGVTVIVWRLDREVQRVVTGPTGAFVLDSAAVQNATAIVVRKIGYLPVTLAPHQRVPSAAPRRIMLQRMTVALPTIVSTEGANLCRGKANVDESPEGRALWHAAASRTLLVAASQGVLNRVRITTGTVHPSFVGQVDESVLAPGWRGTHGSVRAWASETIRQTGYTRPNPTGAYRLYDNLASDRWWYAPLTYSLPDHFLTSEFGERHFIRVLGKPGGQTLLAFCGRIKNGGLEGTLLLDTDSALVRARWQYRTAKPQEDAGGAIDYAPRGNSEAARTLTPLSSVFWRREGNSGYYYQEATLFIARIISESGEIPRQPPQRVIRSSSTSDCDSQFRIRRITTRQVPSSCSTATAARPDEIASTTSPSWVRTSGQRSPAATTTHGRPQTFRNSSTGA
jgi:hypothetical protein